MLEVLMMLVAIVGVIITPAVVIVVMGVGFLIVAKLFEKFL